MKNFLATVATSAPTRTDTGDLMTMLQRVYGALVEGDCDCFAKSLSDSLVLNISGFGPMDGRWQGRDEVVAATRKNFAMVENQKPIIESMISEAESAVHLRAEAEWFPRSVLRHAWCLTAGVAARKHIQIIRYAARDSLHSPLRCRPGRRNRRTG